MQPQASPIASMFPLILIFVVFYFLLIRPQQKKQKDHAQMVKSLEKNDEIVTTGGIHGTIANVKDATVTLRVDDNVRVELQKNCVAHVKKKREG
ncbi:MAG: preprotein translocase subunit YajC [Candidatus Omnitrophica bacterium]|nr:preprotein translocase subunit YajC [Candidatus Omnitrophota bacterium]